MSLRWVNSPSKKSLSPNAPAPESPVAADSDLAGEELPEWISIPRTAWTLDVSQATVWRWIKTVPGFPKPVKLSPGCTRLNARKLAAYIRSLEASK
jgi:prophage regulatory protein